MSGAATVEQMEACMRLRMIDAVAAIVGREMAEGPAAEIEPPAQLRAPHEFSPLASAEAERKTHEGMQR